MIRAFIAAIAIASFSIPTLAEPVLPSPLIVAHRGASGYLPEHTIEAYILAIEQGAHVIEPDLVITKDGVLIARHENALSGTTDVAEKFPDRKTTKTIDGREIEDWFSEDFTLAEIKTLRAVERLENRDQSNNGKFQIPTFQEVVSLALAKSEETGREIGLYPETKHPSYFQDIGLPLEPPLVQVIRQNGLDRADAPVFIQSFEFENLMALNEEVNVQIIQLLAPMAIGPNITGLPGTDLPYTAVVSPEGLRHIATYADGIGPWKGMISDQNMGGQIITSKSLITDAQAAGLKVHAYTFRSDDVPERFGSDYMKEYQTFFEMGLDGLFSDFPDHAVAAASAFSED